MRFRMAKVQGKDNAAIRYSNEDGQPYALAGIWEKWKDRKADEGGWGPGPSQLVVIRRMYPLCHSAPKL